MITTWTQVTILKLKKDKFEETKKKKKTKTKNQDCHLVHLRQLQDVTAPHLGLRVLAQNKQRITVRSQQTKSRWILTKS